LQLEAYGIDFGHLTPLFDTLFTPTPKRWAYAFWACLCKGNRY